MTLGQKLLGYGTTTVSVLWGTYSSIMENDLSLTGIFTNIAKAATIVTLPSIAVYIVNNFLFADDDYKFEEESDEEITITHHCEKFDRRKELQQLATEAKLTDYSGYFNRRASIIDEMDKEGLHHTSQFEKEANRSSSIHWIKSIR